MPKAKDPSLTVTSKSSDKKYYKSSLKAVEKNNEDKYDLMSFRMPKGGKDALKEYLDRRKKEEPDNPKYSTFYAFINTLINDEMQKFNLKNTENSDII